ncbi:MAG: UDP-N-acetylglucosamine 2-epimerase [Gemmatimonadota bacterium]
MSAPRRVCVVTGSRAEFDLLRWLMADVREDPALELQVVATGMHLSPEFGRTVTHLEEAGFPPDDIVESLLSADTPSAVAKSVGLGLIGFADVFRRLDPDIVVILGDRFESFAAAQAAAIARHVIAHVHGGEAAEGAVDEAIRHAITKMAHYHFVATDEYRRRVIQLGEDPDRVFDFGAPGLDRLRRTSLLSHAAVAEFVALSGDGPLVVATYHPVTLSDRDQVADLDEVLAALAGLGSARIVITLANADAAGRALNDRLRGFESEHPDRVRLFAALGQERYLSLLAAAAVVVGNSSSGIIEAPSVGTPTVNVGPRQRGRVRGASVIDCDAERSAVQGAIERAFSADFLDGAFAEPSPYDRGGASHRICAELARVPLEGVVMKRFYDLPARGS